jgi:hypothetical protein
MKIVKPRRGADIKSGKTPCENAGEVLVEAA